MLIVAGTMQVDPEQRQAFLAGRQEAVMAVRAEPGCVDYIFSADPYDPALVRLFERWESKEALAAFHLAARRPEASPAADRVRSGASTSSSTRSVRSVRSAADRRPGRQGRPRTAI